MKYNVKNIAIIPARGGSKRIPHKNLKDFLGEPIIFYSIEAAKRSDLFDEVMVSTDNIEIAEIGKKLGANIPFMRSAKNADDFATTADVLIEVLKEYKKIGKEFDYICCIYPTAPFVTAQKLQDSFKLIIDKNLDSVVPVVKFSYPIQRAFRINRSFNLEYIWPENINKRSQDLETTYHDAGQFYWIKPNALMLNKSLITSQTLPIVVPEVEVQDIDNEEDWKIAEIKYKILLGNTR